MDHNVTNAAANAALYLDDFTAWCAQTAGAIRAGDWDTIDREALAEEVESLGKRDSRELESRLEVLVMHLLKWEYQPDRRQEGHSWADTIMAQRHDLARLLRDNPSLRPRLPTILADGYPNARRRALGQMAPGMPLIDRTSQGLFGRGAIPLPPPALPLVCPWTVEQVLEPEFWPVPLPPDIV